jgi:hypothetical protein
VRPRCLQCSDGVIQDNAGGGREFSETRLLLLNLIGCEFALPLPALLVEFGGPVEKDGHGRGLALLHRRVDQKALAVPAHVVDE